MKALKIFGIVLLVLLVVATVLFCYVRHRLNNVKDHGDLEASLDIRAQKLMGKEAAYGLVIGVYKGGRSFIKGYGSVQTEKNNPPDSTTIFELASTSKLFTKSLLQILCDRGVVHPDDKIADLLRK